MYTFGLTSLLNMYKQKQNKFSCCTDAMEHFIFQILPILINHSYPSTVNEINLQQCMNDMVSTYNDTLFTTAAAKSCATAAVAAPTEKAAEAAQPLTKIRQRFH